MLVLMQLDRSFSFEGVTMAIGVMAAVTAYIASLARSWYMHVHKSRQSGTRMMILGLLEQHLLGGLSGIDLWRLYSDPANRGLLRKYNAWPAAKLNETAFENELKQLQLDGLIDLAGRNHYRLRFRPIDRHELEQAAEAATTSLVLSMVNRERLRSVASMVARESRGSYEKERAIRLLLRLQDQESVSEAIRALDNDDPSIALAAAERLADFVVTGRR